MLLREIGLEIPYHIYGIKLGVKGTKEKNSMILYRPVGTKELQLIADSGYKKFPPRLPEQPIFYPVLNEKYATEIAKNWNVKYNNDHKGYVTKIGVCETPKAA